MFELAKRENVWLYPIGIISILLWIYLCWVGKLYGQSVINLFFFLMNGYGWYNWLRKDDDNNPNVLIKITLIEKIFSFYNIFIFICNLFSPITFSR